MSLPTYLQILGVVLGIATLLGGVVLAFRASYSNARIQALREDNDDLRKRVTDTEHEVEVVQTREAACELKIKHLERENDILRGMVTQRADVSGVSDRVEDLGELLTMHHAQSMREWKKMTEAIEKLADSHEHG